ncbi:MAG: AbrB/MazE/SpoVT family DNA-binding domain-containing protein [Myxococcota bacterium]|jgi:AbrB family looped-hinge helix DNA binding protein|nr:AbrB/MazE/SpoVT family DNA-binding domain-containing protein [Myxococcota bacterium]
MLRTTVSSKGQVVIPKEVRDLHGWTSGTVLEVEVQGDAILLHPVPAFAQTTVDCTVSTLS